MTVWPVAVVTFREGVRNRAMFGISFFALLLLAASLVITVMVPHDVGKVAVDMALSAVSISGLLLVLFIGINLMAKDLDRRTIYMVLARPISRAEYLAGKFLGLALLLMMTVSLVGSFGLGAIALNKLWYPNYFPETFSWPLVILALAFSFVALVLLLALSFLFASFVSNSFLTLVLTVLSYLIGHAIHDVKVLVETPTAVGIEVSRATVALVRGAYFLFPNLSLFDLKQQAANGLAVPLSQIFWTLSYGVVYGAIALLLALLIFGRREFP